MTSDIAVNIDGGHIRVDYSPAVRDQDDEWWLERSPDGTTWTHLNYPDRIPAGAPSTVDIDPPLGESFQYRIRTGKTGVCAVYTGWIRATRDDTGVLGLEFRPIGFSGMIEGLRHHAGM